MSVLLGIDTGGTYTDAVLLDDKHGIIETAKALTTKHDLSIGIRNAVQEALPHPPPDIQLVSLSSTLATNAIVEGKGSPIGLLLIGYEPQTIEDMGLERLTDRRIVFIPGGHTVKSEEQCPLDIKAARQAILTQTPYVSAFAVSGFFGVLNPRHELRVKRLVRHLTEVPVTCGHELTTRLDAPLRALTVALNARLIPLMHQLILQIRQFLATQGIQAPLMVVKGDGSLMDANVALERPVETTLSGPAASVIGGLHLCDVQDAFVMDMGGTTTDIAAVRGGCPTLNEEGARVGGWQTMVEAADIHTTGLGGDSEIQVDDSGKLIIGPRRVVPLSLLALEHPEIVEILQRQLNGPSNSNAGHFIMRERTLNLSLNSLSSTQQRIWEQLGNGPVSVSQLFDNIGIPGYLRYSLDGLIEHSLVAVSAFTPTDAVHVLGQYCHGSVEAAGLGAELWAKQLGTNQEELCNRIVNRVITQAGHALVESALAEEGHLYPDSQDKVGHLLVSSALDAETGSNLAVTFSLRRPIIGIGAPATTYLRRLAEKLNTKVRIPERAEVANAIGAVVGGIVQHVRLHIGQPRGIDGTYRVHLPFGVRDFESLENAASYARNTADRLARHRAHRAGAGQVKVRLERKDRVVMVCGERLYLGTEILATAVGRPRIKQAAVDGKSARHG
ncbi:MAG: hypothetical protein CL874_02540 [Dehalococcoidales bacterium]|nr:hypothetical protein [Dehalococcoidales bacterium]MDP6576246.1 hydantoinase/oxoprolinase N-terminal domain-containing protein [Dehalococcoidales bacterium]